MIWCCWCVARWLRSPMITYTIRCQSSEFHWRKLIYSNLRTPLAHCITILFFLFFYVCLLVMSLARDKPFLPAFISLHPVTSSVNFVCDVALTRLASIVVGDDTQTILTSLPQLWFWWHPIANRLRVTHLSSHIIIMSQSLKPSIGDDIPTIIPVLQH